MIDFRGTYDVFLYLSSPGCRIKCRFTSAKQKSLGVPNSTSMQLDTLNDILTRIAEMPARCKNLVANNGERINSKLW